MEEAFLPSERGAIFQSWARGGAGPEEGGVGAHEREGGHGTKKIGQNKQTAVGTEKVAF